MTQEEIDRVLDEIQYKPGWKLDYWFEEMGSKEMLNLRWLFVTTDSYNPWKTVEMQSHGVTFIPYTEEELVREVYLLAQRAEVHECSEFFQYKGERPFDPHKSLITEGDRYAVEA